MPNADVSHARPLRAVAPELGRTEVAAVGEDYSEFLICMEDDANRGSVSVCEQRNAALARQAVGGKKLETAGSSGFVAWWWGRTTSVITCCSKYRVDHTASRLCSCTLH